MLVFERQEGTQVEGTGRDQVSAAQAQREKWGRRNRYDWCRRVLMQIDLVNAKW